MWNGLNVVRPRLIVIEYNAAWVPPLSVTQPDGGSGRSGSNYFGCSFEALVCLGKKKGDGLVGFSFAGTNAFFVRNDLVGDHFLAPFSAAAHYNPPIFYALPLARPSRRHRAAGHSLVAATAAITSSITGPQSPGAVWRNRVMVGYQGESDRAIIQRQSGK